MRVQKSDVIGGVPAPVAREIVRRVQGSPRVAEVAEHLFPDKRSLDAAFIALADEGYLRPDHIDKDGDIWWQTTMLGNSLTMASFGKPIKRATADRLLREVVARAEAFNRDPSHIVVVERLRVFGSYLDETVTELGDLDLEVMIANLTTDPQAPAQYADASGRSFSTFLDRLLWPKVEVLQILRNRSGAISITEDDISTLTDNVRTVYRFDLATGESETTL